MFILIFLIWIVTRKSINCFTETDQTLSGPGPKNVNKICPNYLLICWEHLHVVLCLYSLSKIRFKPCVCKLYCISSCMCTNFWSLSILVGWNVDLFLPYIDKNHKFDISIIQLFRLEQERKDDLDIEREERQFKDKIRRINLTRVELVNEYQAIVKVCFTFSL